MTQPKLRELAKQGDPAAIATMMSQQLQPRGISVKTNLLPGNCLQVVLESAQPLNRQALTTFVQKGLSNLGVQTIYSIQVIGKQTDATEPDWIQNTLIMVPPREDFEEAIAPVSMAAATANVDNSAVMASLTDVDSSPAGVMPPPPPPNRGTLFTSDDVTPEPPLEANTDAAALHDFYDNPAPDLYPDNGEDLGSYTPMPGAYRPLGADDDVQLVDDDVPLDEADDVALQGTHALDYPDSPLEESGDYRDEYGDDYDVMPGGSFALHHPDEALDDPDEYGDDYDVMPGGSFALHHPDEPLDDPEDYGDDYDEGFVTGTTPNAPSDDRLLALDEYDDYDEGLLVGQSIDERTFSEGAEPEGQLSQARVVESVDGELVEEGYSPIPWFGIVVTLVAVWVLGLVGISLWSATSNLSAQQSPDPGVAPATAPTASPPVATAPPASPEPTASPQGSPTTPSPIAQNPASPSPGAASPGAVANPALQFSPSPQATTSAPASPSPQASPPAASPSPQASPPPAASPATTGAIAVPPPPAIACRPVPFGANSGPVELSNLGFDTSVADADGHYVVGCITNHSDQAIAKLTLSFQGRSTRNQGVTQTGSTELTFSNLRPRQAVPFRSVYTVNPEINAITIDSISWQPAGSTQTRQVQVSFPLRR